MTTAYANGSTSPPGRSLPGPLRTLPDMGSSWADHIDLDFDTAADCIIAAHARDGEHKDLPVTDLKTWAIAPVEGKFALVPLARHHTPKPLRANGFSNLTARLGAPADFVRKLPAPLMSIATILSSNCLPRRCVSMSMSWRRRQTSNMAADSVAEPTAMV